MLKRIAQLAMAVGLAFSFSSGAMAQQQECKPEVSATGRAALTEPGARSNAITNWRRDAIARYGEFFADFEKAKDSSLRCAKTLMGLQRCEAKGKPCLTQTPGTLPVDVPGISCTSKDSKNCVPEVKWVQSKLSEKGCRTKIDGSAGPSTEEALKCFQRKARLEVTGELNSPTLAALKK